ncbi:LysR family transcriptional regulator [Massilia violaceinigra]|uniref:LysR family transcriptional regulator n=1 Tax=Massilia violaceinigra TaxID=2045208 RepID=A0A2D2DRD4_9BURK|nr:LysR family transcriptional regulator [Massilia violaceinigra]ATQ77537.1 LysR family transcriptional regulator [Massilia violaceinigra]
MQLLNYMHLYVEVARTKNFRKAADSLGMSSSTLSRNIAALEKEIGVRLLHRSTRRVELTEAGEAYFNRCQGIVEEANVAHEALRGEAAHPSGTLRISMPVDFAINYLAPVLAEFARAYPLIDFELDAGARRVDLLAEPFDLAIRMGPAPAAPSTLVARQIALLERHLYASPAYLDQAPPLAHPEDLAHHTLCVAGGIKQDGWVLFNGADSMAVPIASRFRLNSMGLSRALAAQGVGIAVLDNMIARAELASGLLQRVLPQWSLAPIPVHAITDTRLLSARTRLFVDFLKARLGGQDSVVRR